MPKRWGLAIIAGLALVASAVGAERAEAGTSVSVGVGFGAPVYAPPVYYAPPPPPAYYAPAPVYVAPPAYGYVAPPVVFRPAPPVAYYGYYGPYRHWHGPRPVRYW